MIFVMASQNTAKSPNLIIDDISAMFGNGLEIIQIKNERVLTLNSSMEWQNRTGDRGESFVRPITFECASYCQKLGVRDFDNALIVLTPPLSDEVSNVFLQELCFFFR